MTAARRVRPTPTFGSPLAAVFVRFLELRLHDLRHSFAVLRVLLWYRQQANLGVTLPALATYLGHVGIASSQRYLQLTALERVLAAEDGGKEGQVGRRRGIEPAGGPIVGIPDGLRQPVERAIARGGIIERHT